MKKKKHLLEINWDDYLPKYDLPDSGPRVFIPGMIIACRYSGSNFVNSAIFLILNGKPSDEFVYTKTLARSGDWVDTDTLWYDSVFDCRSVILFHPLDIVDGFVNIYENKTATEIRPTNEDLPY